MLAALSTCSLLILVSHVLESTTTPTAGSDSVISAAWYTGWHATDFPLSQVSWSKYTHLTYAFATTTPDVNNLSLDSSDEELIPQFVAIAHQHDVKASLSIGGWTGSRWFSSNVRTAQNRTAFVRTVTDLAQKYQLDGLDFDWEFPGTQGIGCNVVDPSDTENFLSFLEELRNSTIGKGLILSAATLDVPWVSSVGLASTNISRFNQVLDYIEVMNYDIKSNPAFGAGPSSPLNDSCAPIGARYGSAVSSVDAWLTAGMAADSIVLGVPAYGHSFVTSIKSKEGPNASSSSVNATIALYPPYNASVEYHGDKWDSDGGVDVCGNMVGPGGVYTYWGLIDEGLLNEGGSVADGIRYVFDHCSQTPFLFNSTNAVYVSYEDSQSYASKGEFIRSAGLKGFAIWEAGGDLNDTLLDSILNATQDRQQPSSSSAPTSDAKSSANSAHLVCAQLTWFACWTILVFIT